MIKYRIIQKQGKQKVSTYYIRNIVTIKQLFYVHNNKNAM